MFIITGSNYGDTSGSALHPNFQKNLVQVRRSFSCAVTNPNSTVNVQVCLGNLFIFYNLCLTTRIEKSYFRWLLLLSDAACHLAAPAVATAAAISPPARPARRHCHRHRRPAAFTFLPSSFSHPADAAATMSGIAAASFFSNVCRFGGCGLHFDSLAELIVHIEDNHIGKRRSCSAGWLAVAEHRG